MLSHLLVNMNRKISKAGSFSLASQRLEPEHEADVAHLCCLQHTVRTQAAFLLLGFFRQDVVFVSAFEAHLAGSCYSEALFSA